MENMDKGLTVPKWLLTVWPKIPQMPQNLSAQFICPSPKVQDFNEKRLLWESVVHAQNIISGKLCRVCASMGAMAVSNSEYKPCYGYGNGKIRMRDTFTGGLRSCKSFL